MSILLTERDLQRTQLVSLPAIQAHILTQRIENEIALGDRERCFLVVHDGRGRLGPIARATESDFLLFKQN